MASRTPTDPIFHEDPEAHDPGIKQAAANWERDVARRALDELFVLAQKYRSTPAYFDLMGFIARFRGYSPFNAMLVRTQMQGATFVAPANRWLRQYGPRITAAARPLVILQPMGPVMFVFDVSDTVSEPDAPPLPEEVARPFDVRGEHIGNELQSTIDNAVRDGVEVSIGKVGSQGAGSICKVTTERRLHFLKKLKPEPEFVEVPHRYDLLLAEGHSAESQYATLVHELAHLYCGHLGPRDPRWWPDRRFLDRDCREFEAESVSYLVCRRLGLDTPSEQYLAGYTRDHQHTPAISLECVLKSAGLIEQMGRQRMPLRQGTTT